MFKINNNYASLTPDSILPTIENDEFFKNKALRVTENTLVFCTILYLHYYYFKNKNGENANDETNPFQRIGTDLIIRILARDNYKDILQRLIELEIVEIDHSYLASQFSKGYRLNDKLLGQQPIARKLKYKWLTLIFWGLGIKFLDSKEKKFGISNPS